MKNCRCSGTAGCQCPPPDDLERRTREGRLTFLEAITKLHGRHCTFVERNGYRLKLSADLTVVDENNYCPALTPADYLSNYWHMVGA